ncbi:hypothetical protein [uncultured Eubacterium sp.]|uniref:hypothetical protein n=1 Tax=uncultured Eubacterium sp. TaxID=165185 RepID=UPI002670D619|nr:hypothetical protein [uncultured Eubacterium sp.]
MGWKEKFSRFMYGRYGVDQLSRFMITSTFILCILSFFTRGRISSLISTLILILIILVYLRMFSRNIYKRSAENEKYLHFISNFKRNNNIDPRTREQKKYYKFFKCPGCGQKIRIPKGHGKIEIRCPKCHHKFIRRS